MNTAIFVMVVGFLVPIHVLIRLLSALQNYHTFGFVRISFLFVPIDSCNFVEHFFFTELQSHFLFCELCRNPFNFQFLFFNDFVFRLTLTFQREELLSVHLQNEVELADLESFELLQVFLQSLQGVSVLLRFVTSDVDFLHRLPRLVFQCSETAELSLQIGDLLPQRSDFGVLLAHLTVQIAHFVFPLRHFGPQLRNFCAQIAERRFTLRKRKQKRFDLCAVCFVRFPFDAQSFALFDEFRV